MFARREKLKKPAAPVINGQEGLTETLYGELRRLAAARLAREMGLQTLQPTALVHEAWLRIGGESQPDWASRAQFFSAAANAMRQILVDRARRRQAIRHGGGKRRVDLDADFIRADLILSPVNKDPLLLALNDALEDYASLDPKGADLVKFRYFGGFTMEEAASSLGLSKRSAERRLSFARAWLARHMCSD